MKLAAAVRVRRPTGFTVEVDFDVEAEALALVGPSGSGKSTVLDALAGVERGAPVRLDGRDLGALPPERRGVGYVTQDALLFPHLDVRANLSYSPRAGTLDEVVAALDLEPLLARRPAHLSGGERRRVALARALVSAPDWLLLDEPFAGLDGPRRRDALSLIHAVRRRFALPVVIVSHQPEDVIGLADHALRLEDGRLVAQGTPASVLRAGETAIDNHVTGHVVGPGRVTVDGVDLAVTLPADARGPVRLACYARDVLLATEAPRGLSARNVVATEVAAVEACGDGHLVHLAAPRLAATVTREALEELDLRPGRALWVVLKATALTWLGPAGPAVEDAGRRR